MGTRDFTKISATLSQLIDLIKDDAPEALVIEHYEKVKDDLKPIELALSELTSNLQTQGNNKQLVIPDTRNLNTAANEVTRLFYAAMNHHYYHLTWHLTETAIKNKKASGPQNEITKRWLKDLFDAVVTIPWSFRPKSLERLRLEYNIVKDDENPLPSLLTSAKDSIERTKTELLKPFFESITQEKLDINNIEKQLARYLIETFITVNSDHLEINKRLDFLRVPFIRREYLKGVFPEKFAEKSEEKTEKITFEQTIAAGQLESLQKIAKQTPQDVFNSPSIAWQKYAATHFFIERYLKLNYRYAQKSPPLDKISHIFYLYAEGHLQIGRDLDLATVLVFFEHIAYCFSKYPNSEKANMRALGEVFTGLKNGASQSEKDWQKLQAAVSKENIAMRKGTISFLSEQEINELATQIIKDIGNISDVSFFKTISIEQYANANVVQHNSTKSFFLLATGSKRRINSARERLDPVKNSDTLIEFFAKSEHYDYLSLSFIVLQNLLFEPGERKSLMPRLNSKFASQDFTSLVNKSSIYYLADTTTLSAVAAKIISECKKIPKASSTTTPQSNK